MGFFASVRQGFSFIKQAYLMAFQNKRLLLPSLYMIVLSIIYYVAWIAAIILLEVDLEGELGHVLEGICLFGSFIIFYFFMGMTVHVVDKHIEGKPFTIGEAFADSVQNFMAIFWLALISTAIELASAAARRAADQEGGAAIVGALLMSVIESVWTVASFLLLPIIIIEDVGFGTALKRATMIFKRKLLPIAVGEVGVRIAANIVAFIVILPLVFILAPFASAGGQTGLIMVILVGGTVLTLLASFQVFVRMAYYTCLYHWAVACEREGAGARAPSILATAMAR